MKQSCSVLRLGRAMAIEALPCSKAVAIFLTGFGGCERSTIEQFSVLVSRLLIYSSSLVPCPSAFTRLL